MAVTKAILVACIIGLTAATFYQGNQINRLEQVLDDLSTLADQDGGEVQTKPDIAQDLARYDRRIVALEQSFAQLARSVAAAHYSSAPAPAVPEDTSAPPPARRTKQQPSKQSPTDRQYQRAQQRITDWAARGFSPSSQRRRSSVKSETD